MSQLIQHRNGLRAQRKTLPLLASAPFLLSDSRPRIRPHSVRLLLMIILSIIHHRAPFPLRQTLRATPWVPLPPPLRVAPRPAIRYARACCRSKGRTIKRRGLAFVVSSYQQSSVFISGSNNLTSLFLLRLPYT